MLSLLIQKKVDKIMGNCFQKPDVVDGALVVDSIVISNSKVRFNGNIISIPVKSLSSGEASVINIDKDRGILRISRGMLHGRLSHDSLIEEIKHDDDEQLRKSSKIYRESFHM